MTTMSVEVVIACTHVRTVQGWEGAVQLGIFGLEVALALGAHLK